MTWFHLQSPDLKGVLRWGLSCARAQHTVFKLHRRQGIWRGSLWIPVQFPYGGVIIPCSDGIYCCSDSVHLVTLRSGSQRIPYWEGIYTWDGRWQRIARETL